MLCKGSCYWNISVFECIALEVTAGWGQSGPLKFIWTSKDVKTGCFCSYEP